MQNKSVLRVVRMNRCVDSGIHGRSRKWLWVEKEKACFFRDKVRNMLRREGVSPVEGYSISRKINEWGGSLRLLSWVVKTRS